jgi:hypothetical protein
MYKIAQSERPLKLLKISTRFRILQSMPDPVDESLSIHLEHIVHLPNTRRCKGLLVHMNVAIVGAAIRCVHVQIHL